MNFRFELERHPGAYEGGLDNGPLLAGFGEAWSSHPCGLDGRELKREAGSGTVRAARGG